MARSRIITVQRAELASQGAAALACVLGMCSALAFSAMAHAQAAQDAEPAAAASAPVAPAYSPRFMSPEQRLAISSELRDVEERISYMNYEQRDGRIAGPIAMVASGYGTALVAMVVAFVGVVSAEDVQHWDEGDDWSDHLDANDDGSIDTDDERTFRRMARGFGVLSGVGAAVGIAGSVFLAKRMRVRRQQAPELRALERRRQDLRRQLEYGASFSARGLTLGVQGRF